jgi:DNA-binding transcriptional LysR family regulator
MNDAVVAEMREADFSGEVKLGVPHDVVGVLMPPILRTFRQEHPNVLITLVSDVTKRLRALLREGAIDLTLTTELENADRGHQLRRRTDGRCQWRWERKIADSEPLPSKR